MSGPREVAQRTAGNMLNDASRDYLGLIAAGLGLSISGLEMVGGVLLAVGGGALVAHVRRKQHPEHERFAWWFTLVAAVFFATLAGMASPHLFPEWPPQILMALAGVASRGLVLFIIKGMDTLVSDAPGIVRRVVEALLRDRGGQP